MTRAGLAEWRATAHAVLLAGAVTLAAPASAQPPQAAFAPPADSPLILSRTVARELRDGAQIVATRHYRVTFHPIAEGWQVDGTLIASEIDVPPALAVLAAIERERPDEGMFPILLDRTGRIVSEPSASGLGREAVAGALGAAKQLAAKHLPETGAAAAPAGFLAQIGAAAASPGGGQTAWPEALFLPGGLSGTTEQVFKLPDGSDGSIQVSLDCEAAPGLATMGRARRTVVTQVAGSRRVAREEWTLGPIVPSVKP